MALHGYDVRPFGVTPTGKVMTSGFSSEVPINTVALISKDKSKSGKKGAKVLETLKGIDKNKEKISILFGAKKREGRYGGDKHDRTVPFTLSDVKKVTLSNPKVEKQEVDYFRIGWDGVNDNTSLKFYKGQTFELSVTIGGIAATFLGACTEHTVKQHITIPNNEFSLCENVDGICDAVDCREHTINLVKQIKNYLFPGGYKFSEFYNIYPIFKSVTPNAKPVPYKQYCLDFCDSDNVTELYEVAAQYPGKDVKRDPKTGKFVIFQKADAPAPVAYKKSKDKFMLKGCACPDEYTEVKGGFLYIVRIEDDGEDKKAVVASLPTAISGTEAKLGGERGFGQYSVILEKKLTSEAEKTFVEANPTATILFSGKKESFCECEESVTYEWEECGSCNASCATYRIMIPDDCSRNRLEDLKAAYPDLEITEVKSQNCLSVFETTVETGLSCDTGCAPEIVQQVFEAKAPIRFEEYHWYPYETEQTKGTTLCGIEIKAKPVILNPSQSLENDVPFIHTSSRILNVYGGSVLNDGTWNVMPHPDHGFAVKRLSIAKDLDNMFGSDAIQGWIKRGRFYFQDVVPGTSNIEKYLRGDVHLDNTSRLSTLTFAIEVPNFAGLNGYEYTRIQYKLLVPFGKTQELEKLFGEIAGAAGVPFEVL